MKYLSLVIVAAALVVSSSAHAQVRVVASVPDLAALAREVGGDKIRVESLSLSTQDPHYVDAKPSLALKLNRAQLLVAVGLGLEVGWLPKLLVSARNGQIQAGARGYLDCSESIQVRDVPKGKVSRAMGDIHAQGNPHYLLDPREALRCAKSIADRLTALDPVNASYYYARYGAFSQAVKAHEAKWAKQHAGLRGVKVITYHKSLSYLADFVGLDVAEVIEVKPGVAPSPSHVARLIANARNHNVKLILQEEYYPTRTGTLIADKTGAKLVRISGGANFSANESYLANIGQVLAELAK